LPPGPEAKVRTTAAAMTTRWYPGVIALAAWQAQRSPAGSKIVKGSGCAAEVGKPGMMGVVLGGVERWAG
jgi:hypothetical protein